VGPLDWGVYVHVPYCARRCPYCDFAIQVGAQDDEAYTEAILRELDSRGEAFQDCGRIRTLYFGGGTPSRLEPQFIAAILRYVGDRFGWQDRCEVTLEANPEDLTQSKLEALQKAGVNRLSLGIQSFRAEELQFLGRAHTPAAAQEVVRMATSLGIRVSCDLIYGLPDQTLAHLEENLAVLGELDVDHVSAYVLTVEPRTRLARRIGRKEIVPADDDQQADAMERVHAWMADAGLLHYEVSSFGRPGHFALHNSLYWTGQPYLGLGPGAHSFLPPAGDRARGLRTVNERATRVYLERIETSGAAVGGEESLDAETLLAEHLAVAVRASWGIDRSRLRAASGSPYVPALEDAIGACVEEGLLTDDGLRLRPTPRGFMLNNVVAERLYYAARDGLPLNPRRLLGPMAPTFAD
jgi:oxygen-independent coproporphyrinogen III oxidase